MFTKWPTTDRLKYWHPILPVRDLGKKPVAVKVSSTPMTVYRETDGSITALYDRCAHRRAPLSGGFVSKDGVHCPYHGCIFDRNGQSFCPTTGNKRFEIPAFDCKVAQDMIWVRSRNIGTADYNPIDLVALQSEDEVFGGIVNLHIKAPFQLVIDNMSELEHTGSVHRYLAFDIHDFDSVTTAAELDDDTVKILYSGRQRGLPGFLRAISGLQKDDFYHQTAEVRMDPPHANYKIWWADDDKSSTVRPFGLRFTIFYTPIDETNTRLFAFLYWNAKSKLRHKAMQITAPIYREIVKMELKRDQAIIESLPAAECTLDYFKLSKFDKPMRLSRALVDRKYSDTAPKPPEMHS